MVDSPQASLKVVFIVHFVLTTWAAMAGAPFLNSAYIYMNVFVLAFGFWAIIVPESSDSVLMFLILNLVSILQDIIFLSVFGPFGNHLRGGYAKVYKFSLGMGIVNLLIKPFTSFILYRIYQSRGGRYGDLGIPGVPQFAGPSSGGGYENIDTDVPSSISNVETAAPHNAYKPPQ